MAQRSVGKVIYVKWWKPLRVRRMANGITIVVGDCNADVAAINDESSGQTGKRERIR
jgi:hypothetical protein